MSQEDWDRLQYYSRKVKAFRVAYDYDPQVHPSTYVRIAQLQPSGLFPSLRRLSYYLTDISVSYIYLFLSPLLDSLEFRCIYRFEDIVVGPFLATLSSTPQMPRRIVISYGRMPVDVLKKSIVNFKQLRSLELLVAVSFRDFSLWEVLGTLPSLENLTLEDTYYASASHPRHAPENSSSQSTGLRHFDALESLHVAGSVFLIQHLLGFIDSPCLKSIEVSVIRWPEDLLTPFMTIVSSKWSQSLKNLAISLISIADLNGITLRDPTLSRPPSQVYISIPTLRIIAENYPELRCLVIQLDVSTIPPFDDIYSKSLRHNLDVLKILDVRGPDTTPQSMLEYQIDVARHLDLIFPYLKAIEVQDENWFGICNLRLIKFCEGQRQRWQRWDNAIFF